MLQKYPLLALYSLKLNKYTLDPAEAQAFHFEISMTLYKIFEEKFQYVLIFYFININNNAILFRDKAAAYRENLIHGDPYIFSPFE